MAAQSELPNSLLEDVPDVVITHHEARSGCIHGRLAARKTSFMFTNLSGRGARSPWPDAALLLAAATQGVGVASEFMLLQVHLKAYRLIDDNSKHGQLLSWPPDDASRKCQSKVPHIGSRTPEMET